MLTEATLLHAVDHLTQTDPDLRGDRRPLWPATPLGTRLIYRKYDHFLLLKRSVRQRLSFNFFKINRRTKLNQF